MHAHSRRNTRQTEPAVPVHLVGSGDKICTRMCCQRRSVQQHLLLNVVRAIILRSQLLSILVALRALDTLNLIMNVAIDRVVRIILWLRHASIGVVVLVDGPSTAGRPRSQVVVVVSLAVLFAVVAAATNRTYARVGPRGASRPTGGTKRSATLTGEGVVEVVCCGCCWRAGRLW